MENSLKNRTYYLLQEYGRKCLENSEISGNSSFCPTVFDGQMCWKKTRAGETALQSCSSNELLISTYQGVASLFCEKNGKWFTIYNNTETTANYSECGTLYAKYPIGEDIYTYTKWLPILRKCTHVGYAFSITSLIVSLLIFFCIKRLHCSRNYLHINLFISSIMRCFMSILKDVLFVKGTILFTETSNENGPITNQTETFWICKAVISLWQYFILTNYMMLLMEGIYLHNLIFLKLFSDKTNVMLYAITGWGLPFVFVVPWIVLRIINESPLCWTIKDKTSLLMEIPTGTIVMINFILFLLIVRVLCLKLNLIFIQQRRTKYRKLFKATLILLPLFGVPYTISVVLSFYVHEDKTLEIIWLFFDQSFTAFQGFLAALAYCLLNGDVQTEIRRKYHFAREKSELRRSRTISHTLQSFIPNDDMEMQQSTQENGKLQSSL